MIYIFFVLSLAIFLVSMYYLNKWTRKVEEKATEPYLYNQVCKIPLHSLIKLGMVKVGNNVSIDENVWVGHPDNSGRIGGVEIGDGCYLRTGTVIYTDVKLGKNVKTGQHAVIRERCTIGDNCLIGTAVTIENDSVIGNKVSLETGSHVTGHMTIEDGVFYGAYVVSTNDMKMNWNRPNEITILKGATIKKNARIGSGAILLPNVTVGENAIVNVGEVVRKDILPNTMYFTHRTKSVYKKIGG